MFSTGNLTTIQNGTKIIHIGLKFYLPTIQNYTKTTC